MSRPLALITGANRGIGRAIAIHLARGGFDCVAGDLAHTADTVETKRLVLAQGGGFHFVALDIAETASHAPVIAGIRAEHGPLACLVNNAGVQTRTRGDILDVTPEEYDRLLGVNLRGTFFLTQAVAREMMGDEVRGVHRSIVTISSSAATIAFPSIAPYCLSKTGLSMMTKLFAIRLAEHGISTYEVRPGFIRTDMTGPAADGYSAFIESGGVPQRRWGTPDDVGQAVATLASGGFAYVTGEVISVGGGLQIEKF